MLTRIEIDGFKSFADLELDLPSFLVIIGPNASGKSNLFDAIQLLRRLAGMSLFDAFAEARGDIGELFRRRGDGTSVDIMRFAVEVLLEPKVVDQFGSAIEVSHTRFRYELAIQQRQDTDGFLRPYVLHERAVPLKSAEDDWVRDNITSTSFRRAHLRYKRQTALLETGSDEAGQPVFKLAQEGRQGRKRALAAHAAEATVLSSVTTASEFPLLYALRKELESWRFMQLDPAVLRQPSTRQQRGEQLEPSGANLARVLRRVQQRSEDGLGGLLEEIASDLARVIRGLRSIEVEENASKEQWEVYLVTRDEGRINARVASDGTLRVLALLSALYDPDYRGLVCFEEPENGIYPQRLRDLVHQLRELVTHPEEPVHPDNPEPLAQLILSSHSPLLLLTLPREDFVVVDWVSRIEVAGTAPSRITRVRRLREPGQEVLPLQSVGSVVPETERRAYAAISVEEARQLLEV